MKRAKPIELEPLDRLAVDMARESRVWEACSALGALENFSGGNPKDPMHAMLAKANRATERSRELAVKAHPELALSVLLRGSLEEPTDEPLDIDHGDVDRAIEARFVGLAVSPDSESDSFWCYCSKEMAPKVEAWLRERFPGLDFGSTDPTETSIHGLGTWDDAERWCIDRKLDGMQDLTLAEKATIREAAEAKSSAMVESARKAGSLLADRLEALLS